MQGGLVNLVANVFLWILLLKTMDFLEWNSFRKYAKDEESKALIRAQNCILSYLSLSPALFWEFKSKFRFLEFYKQTRQ